MGFFILLGLVLVGLPVFALTAEVKDVKGAPCLVVDGQPTPPLMLFAYAYGRYVTEANTDGEWQEFTTQWKQPEDNTDGTGGLQIRPGREPGVVWVDDVRIVDQDGNLIGAEDFEDSERDKPRWTYWSDGGDQVAWEVVKEADGNGALRAELLEPSTYSVPPHLIRSGYQFHKDVVYTLTLRLKAEPRRQLAFCTLRQGPPWTQYSGDMNTPYDKQAPLARDAGVHIISPPMGIPWPAPGEEPDFTGLDEMMGKILETDPKALVLPRTGAQPPQWWLDEHPEELASWSDGQGALDYGGRIPSVASEPWRADYDRHLRVFIRHMEEQWGDHILGYHPCGQHTGEWFYVRSWEGVWGETEEAFRAGFARWALQKYGGLTELRQAWGQPELAMEAIRLPSVEERQNASHGFFRDPVAEKWIVDFHEYQQVAMAEVIELQAKAIKEETDGKKISCFFYGYYFELAGMPSGVSGSGHLAIERLLQNPDIDILCSPISYGQRGPGGLSMFMTMVDSLAANGKLWLVEDDTRTYLVQPGSDSSWIPGPATLQETFWEHDRTFGQMLPRRLACWYMDLPNMAWLASPPLWDNISELRQLYEGQLAKSVTWKPEFAVVADERSPFWMSAQWNPLRVLGSIFREDWYRVGTSTGIYLLEDVLAGKVELPKATLFVGCFRLTSGERQQLAQALEGKTALWMYGSGYVGEESCSTSWMTELTGFGFSEQASGMAGFQLEAGGDLLEGCEGMPYGPVDLPLTPRWSVGGSRAVEALGHWEDGSLALARTQVKGFPTGYTSYYLGSVRAPSQLLRNILAGAGVHLWLDTDDLVVADERFLTICAKEAGVKAIRLPEGASGLVRARTGERLDAVDDVVTDSFEFGETKQYFIAK